MVKELAKKDSQSWKEDRRVYVLNNHKIRKRILQENHNPTDVKHLEQQCILNLIKRNY